MNRGAVAYQPIDPDHLFAGRPKVHFGGRPKVHMLDEPKSLIEDVRPVTPPASPPAKHVFFLSIFNRS